MIVAFLIMMSVVMLSIFMLSVVKLGVIVLSVVTHGAKFLASTVNIRLGCKSL